MAQESSPQIKSSKRTFSILQMIKERRGAGVSELAEQLDIPVSTVHNHLNTLEQLGYVVKDDNTYQIGLRFVYFGDYARNRIKLAQFYQPTLDKLAETTGEMANLLVEECGRGIYVDVSRSSNSLQLDSYVQRREYLHCTAIGQTILAYYDKDRVQSIVDRYGLPKMTEETITDFDELMSELESIREQGYAFDEGERMEGLLCCAAPILGRNDESLGAISVSGPKSRLDDDYFYNELPSIVKDSAKTIEIDIKHS